MVRSFLGVKVFFKKALTASDSDEDDDAAGDAAPSEVRVCVCVCACVRVCVCVCMRRTVRACACVAPCKFRLRHAGLFISQEAVEEGFTLRKRGGNDTRSSGGTNAYAARRDALLKRTGGL